MMFLCPKYQICLSNIGIRLILMVDYLDRIGAGKILLTNEPFSFDWVPPRIVGRDDQLIELASMFYGIADQSISCRAVVTGNVGSGKTVLTQRFGLDLISRLEGKRKVTLSHINCRNHPTTSQVLRQIAGSLDERHPERGFSPGEIIQNIRRNLIAHENHLLLILDEVDVLVRRDSSDLIYKLLRIDEGRSKSGSISMILVSQEQTLFGLFEQAIKSRIGKSRVLNLPPYGEDELIGIANQRYSAACRPGTIGEDIIKKICRTAAEAGGDARMAIELLESSILSAEKNGMNEVSADDVVKARDDHVRFVEPSEVSNLSDHQKLVLLGICRRLKRSEEVSSGDVRKLYELVCEENGYKTRGYTTFWKHIKELELQGMIETRSSSKNRGRGRTQYITMSNSSPGALEDRIERELLKG